jgi:hypothetical protein
MGITSGADSNEYVFSAAGTFRTGSVAPNGAKISIGAMLTVEANAAAGALRITARAVHGKVAQAIKNVVRLHV